MCSDCEAYGLKKHGLTMSDCIGISYYAGGCITPSLERWGATTIYIIYILY